MDDEVGTMLMHRQAPLALGALAAACAAVAVSSVLLREQILSFSSWPFAVDGLRAPDIAIPKALPFAEHHAASKDTPSRRGRARVGAGAVALLSGAPATPGLAAGGAPAPAVVSPSGATTPSRHQGTTWVSATIMGPTSSSAPAGPPAPPLSGYPNPVVVAVPAAGTGIAAPVPAAVAGRPATSATIRVAAGPAEAAPEADLMPISSAADNAPPPADATGTPATPAPTPSPAPTPTPAPVDPPPPVDTTPADPTPPSDPAPPAETPAPPADAPAPTEPAPAPAPGVPPAPADAAPPADPAPVTDPAPAPTPEPTMTTSVASEPAPTGP